MQLFRIENVRFQPLLVIAEDYEHAGQIFMHELITGLHHRPDAEFDVTKWRIKPPYNSERPWSWVKEGKAGILWRLEEEPSWELVGCNMRRE